ncbi:hypothetical protein KXV74_008721 [Aspergillus fumigatus]|nr:hypothetical protein KXX32_007258 [Aspergillus fumigatus]KAH1742642.1 hypothetical protein KXX09_000877 [Aspergillus fumigatus]KAH1849647.1 hypothetical protein KXX54_007740 [Aspergillus fumigatus]KAH1916682.1 hypothetical protein KXW47_002030 [Aspergillus fumigatus]KAH2021738.1 hypothetical protein KXV65_002402 [Aspergillus fumigatus]
MTLDNDANLEVLTDDGILLITQQPPTSVGYVVVFFCGGNPDNLVVWLVAARRFNNTCICDPSMGYKDIIKKYITHHVNNHSHKEEYGKQPVCNKVVQWLQDANIFPTLMAPTTPRVGILKVKDKSLLKLTILWSIV